MSVRVSNIMAGSFLEVDKSKYYLNSIEDYIGLNKVKNSPYFVAVQSGRDLASILHARIFDEDVSNSKAKKLHIGEIVLNEKFSPEKTMEDVKKSHQLNINSVKSEVIYEVYEILFDKPPEKKQKARTFVINNLMLDIEAGVTKILQDERFSHLRLIRFSADIDLSDIYPEAKKSDKYRFFVFNKLEGNPLIEGIRLPTLPVGEKRFKKLKVRNATEEVELDRMLAGD